MNTVEQEIRWLDAQYAAAGQVNWAAFLLDDEDDEAVWRALSARCCRRLNPDEASRRLARAARVKALARFRMQVGGHAYYAMGFAENCLRSYVGEERRRETGDVLYEHVVWKLATRTPCIGLLLAALDAKEAQGERATLRFTPEERAALFAWLAEDAAAARALRG